MTLQDYLISFFNPNALREELLADWEISNVNSNDFLEKNRTWLKQLSLGTSFSVEELEWKSIKTSPKEIADFLIDQLNIKQVRFGLRWSSIDFKENELNFEKYEKYLNEFIERGIKITLNIGPIKTFRWPEVHVPEYILKKLKEVPKNKSQIELNDEITKYAFSYLNKLSNYLAIKYPNFFSTIQIENEHFNPFGEHSWTFSEEYLIEAIAIVNKHFNDSNILLSSPAQGNDLAKTNRTLIKALKLFPDLENRLGSYINYYYLTPFSKIYSSDPWLMKDTVLKTGHGEIRKQRSLAKKFGIRTGITELQAEPWPPFYSPGNTVQELQYALFRSKEFLNLDRKNEVFIWSVEHLLQCKQNGAWTEEHDKIQQLISSINSL